MVWNRGKNEWRRISYNEGIWHYGDFSYYKKKEKITKRNIGGYFPVNFEVDDLNILKKLEKNKVKVNLNVNVSIKDVQDYDYIIIDCAPSLGLITLNALTASNSVIIPIQCEYFALEGLGKLLNTIKSIQKIHNPNLNIEGLLLTMYDSRLRLSNQVVEEVRKHFHNMVFKTIIQRNVTLGEAPSHGKNIIDYDSTSKGAKNYIKLAHELINNNKNG